MRELIEEYVRKHDLLDTDRLDEVFRLEEETGQSFEKIILHKGYMTENDVLRTLAHALDLTYLERLCLEGDDPDALIRAWNSCLANIFAGIERDLRAASAKKTGTAPETAPATESE